MKKLSVIVCTCHPSYFGSLSRRIAVWADPGEKRQKKFIIKQKTTTITTKVRPYWKNN
jgi:hypothetical protein